MCGFVYNEGIGCPEAGIASGTAWEDVSEDFVCPLCRVGKEEFKKPV